MNLWFLCVWLCVFVHGSLAKWLSESRFLGSAFWALAMASVRCQVLNATAICLTLAIFLFGILIAQVGALSSPSGSYWFLLVCFSKLMKEGVSSGGGGGRSGIFGVFFAMSINMYQHDDTTATIRYQARKLVENKWLNWESFALQLKLQTWTAQASCFCNEVSCASKRA